MCGGGLIMKREITCIVCPKGCQMTVDNIDGQYELMGIAVLEAQDME